MGCRPRFTVTISQQGSRQLLAVHRAQTLPTGSWRHRLSCEVLALGGMRRFACGAGLRKRVSRIGSGLLMLCAAPQVDEPVHRAHEHRTADDVADRHGKQIVEQKRGPGEARVVCRGSSDRGPERLRRKEPDEQCDRHKIHIGNAMLKASRDEPGDRRHDREYAIGRRSSTECEPDSQADQCVAQHTQRDCLTESEIQLRIGRGESDCAYAATSERVLPTGEHQRGNDERADEVAEVNHQPIAEEAPQADPSAAQAITIRVLPVNNSAPPTMTRISPSENTSPANKRPTPYGRPSPASTVVANRAPKPMNAPASAASTKVASVSALAFRTPTCSARAAICGGRRASNELASLLTPQHRN